MMDNLVAFLFVVLLIVAIIDWKLRRLPSILLTGLLFVVAFISCVSNPQALTTGILGFIIAYLLYEADFFGGIADVKIMTTISFMLVNTFHLLGFIILTCIFGIVWKAVIKWRVKGDTQCAFLPVFFFVYTTMYFLGGLF